MRKSVSKIHPNKFDVASKQVAGKNGVVVPSEINEDEKDYFHVLIIESRANHVSETFEHRVKKQMFNQETFIKNERDGVFTRLGYGKMVVFHDPTLPVVVESESTLSVKELEKNIENYSVEELEKMLETEERKGAISIIESRIEFLNQ